VYLEAGPDAVGEYPEAVAGRGEGVQQGRNAGTGGDGVEPAALDGRRHRPAIGLGLERAERLEEALVVGVIVIVGACVAPTARKTPVRTAPSGRSNARRVPSQSNRTAVVADERPAGGYPFRSSGPLSPSPPVSPSRSSIGTPSSVGGAT